MRVWLLRDSCTPETFSYINNDGTHCALWWLWMIRWTWRASRSGLRQLFISLGGKTQEREKNTGEKRCLTSCSFMTAILFCPVQTLGRLQVCKILKVIMWFDVTEAPTSLRAFTRLSSSQARTRRRNERRRNGTGWGKRSMKTKWEIEKNMKGGEVWWRRSEMMTPPHKCHERETNNWN